MQRFIVPIFFMFPFFGAPALAETWTANDWFEMSNACEAVIVDQDATVLNGFAPTRSLLNVDGLHELSVARQGSSLRASAVFDGTNWFLCIVVSDPPLHASGAGALIDEWSEAQSLLAERPGNVITSYDDPNLLSTVRVRCRGDGNIATVFAYEADGKFRIGVTDRLPSGVESPC